MSRSGYADGWDIDNWDLIRWRGAVAAAIRGKRGQSFLLELYRAMEALPERKLIAGDLEANGAVCAMGAVGKARGIDMSQLDPEDAETVAAAFGILPKLAMEIVYMNDEGFHGGETPEARYERMRQWVVDNLLPVE